MGDDETLFQRDIQVSLQDVVFGITPHSPLWGFFLPFPHSGGFVEAKR